MKKYIIIAFASLFCAAACSDDVRICIDEIPDVDIYSKVYITQAASSPCVESVFISEDIQTLSISAFYGGAKMPATDIKVEFEARPDLVDSYNEFNGTDYPVMPEGTYSLPTSSAVIKSGQPYSTPVNIEVNSLGMVVSQKYLLPVSIKSVSGNTAVNEALSTVYFVITGSYLPGEVPCEKVLSFGQEMKNPMFCVGEDLIVVDNVDNLLLYRPDENGAYQFDRQIGQGWVFDILFYLPPEKRFLARDRATTNINQYYFDDNYGFPSAATIGFGWGIYKDIFPFSDNSILCIGVSDGALYNWTVDAGGGWTYYGAFATGFGGFDYLFCFDNYLLGVEPNGIMAAYSLSQSNPPSVGSRRNIGTGWNQYTRLFKCGDNLLALDKNGDLWRYSFTPEGYWPLVSE